jgi:hypothetical protein
MFNFTSRIFSFRLYQMLEASKAEIAIHLYGDVIQWYDSFQFCRGVPTGGRLLMILYSLWPFRIREYRW